MLVRDFLVLRGLLPVLLCQCLMLRRGRRDLGLVRERRGGGQGERRKRERGQNGAGLGSDLHDSSPLVLFRSGYGTWVCSRRSSVAVCRTFLLLGPRHPGSVDET